MATQPRCPCCSGTDFRHGAVPDSGGSAISGTNRLRFKPEGNWVTTHELRALACLTCGHVALFLDEGDLPALRQ